MVSPEHDKVWPVLEQLETFVKFIGEAAKPIVSLSLSDFIEPTETG